ncbi:MAG: ATP-binding cassette domain-containing protein, partial [Alphaproteobacteria bacterium]|nr:ATP-binding cassette domain-containing protein [Alphaproteobacteria bacterium]
KNIKSKVSDLLDLFGISDKARKYPHQLSGGQKQRVAIARAVINRPALLLADEPTGNVDDKIAIRLLHLFIEMNKLGTTVVIATHKEALIKKLGFARLHLENGQMKIIPATKQMPQSLAELSTMEFS